MTGSELDQQMRAIFTRAKMETILADTQALIALGFEPYQSFAMLERVIMQRSRADYLEQLGGKTKTRKRGRRRTA